MAVREMLPWDSARLGIACSLGDSEDTARKALSEARQAGFTRAQLQIPWTRVDDSFLRKVPGWLRQEGLQADVLGAYVNCCLPANVWMDCREQDFDRAIETAGLIGARRLVAWTGGYGADLMKADPRNHDPAAEDAVCRFVEIRTRKMESSGLQLALETYITLVCPDAVSLSRLLKRLPNRVGAVLDPPNLTPIALFPQRDKVLKDMFRLLAGRIQLVHLKDFRLAPGGASYLLPGPMEGDLNYRLFLDRIRQLPSDIPVIAEHLSSRQFANARQRLLASF